MEPGGVWVGDGSVELGVILPVISCFFICGFREGFVSCWVWDPVGGLLGSSELPYSRQLGAAGV
jgi:hypothetical protein